MKSKLLQVHHSSNSTDDVVASGGDKGTGRRQRCQALHPGEKMVRRGTLRPF